MKYILFLFALISIAYGSSIREVVIKDNCIGIKDSYIKENRWELESICCTEEVPSSLATYTVGAADRRVSHDILKADYDRLTAGRTNCEYGHKGVA